MRVANLDAGARDPWVARGSPAGSPAVGGRVPAGQPGRGPMILGAVALPGAEAWRSRDLRLGSDRHDQLVDRDGQPPVRRLLRGQLVMPPRTSWTKA